VQIQDLQEQLDQLSRQIAVLRGRIAHITALLADPNLTPDRRAQLETRRAQLQTDLRSTRLQSAGISKQASLATIQLTIATKQKSATPAPASRLRRTLHEAGRILTWEGVALLYCLVVAGPFALAGALAWFGARMRRRSIENRLLARG
jgi:TolA-binding protein